MREAVQAEVEKGKKEGKRGQRKEKGAEEEKDKGDRYIFLS
jgi:hypothetical protein